MLVFIIDEQNGLALPAARWENYVNGIVDQYNAGCTNLEVCVGTENALTYLRRAIQLKKISHNDVVLVDMAMVPNNWRELAEMYYISFDAEGWHRNHIVAGEGYTRVLMDANFFTGE